MKAKISLIILIILHLTAPVSAKEYVYSSDTVAKTSPEGRWESFLSGIPQDVAEELKIINVLDPDETINEVKNKSDIRYWTDKFFSSLKEAIISHIPRFLPIFAMILLLAASKMTLPQTFASLSTSFSMLSKLTLSIAVVSSTYFVINLANNYLNSICNIMNLLTPVMQTVYLAEGSLTKMSVSTSAIMLTVTAIGNINSHVMSPCISVLFILSAVTTVCDEINFSGLTNAIRRFVMRMWQIITIAFSFMLGTQSIIASSADNLAAKTIKFALGSIIPMAGGVLAEAFNTVREGLSFVKTATGIGGIITIFLMLIPGIIPLLLFKVSVIIYIFVADMLNLNGEKSFLEDAKGIIEIIIAIVLYTSLMFVFSIILFTKSQVG